MLRLQRPPGTLSPKAERLDRPVGAPFTGNDTPTDATIRRVTFPRTAGGFDLTATSVRCRTAWLSQYLAIAPSPTRYTGNEPQVKLGLVDAAMEAPRQFEGAWPSAGQARMPMKADSQMRELSRATQLSESDRVARTDHWPRRLQQNRSGSTQTGCGSWDCDEYAVWLVTDAGQDTVRFEDMEFLISTRILDRLRPLSTSERTDIERNGRHAMIGRAG